ncbi:Vps62-related protein, partial [Escherichia coli]|uniref:Vps62-related protein n=1 Tax=Escherichia coli TaxID=562 RepID=UPI0025A06C67
LSPTNLPALREPVDYALIWSSYDWSDENYEGCGFIWLPKPPNGYKPIGYVVTNTSDKPQLHEVRCVRADLTDKCEAYKVIINISSKFSDAPLQIWKT